MAEDELKRCIVLFFVQQDLPNAESVQIIWKNWYD